VKAEAVLSGEKTQSYTDSEFITNSTKDGLRGGRCTSGEKKWEEAGVGKERLENYQTDQKSQKDPKRENKKTTLWRIRTKGGLSIRRLLER